MWATCPSAPPIFHLSKPRKVWTAAKWKWKCFLFSTMWIFQWKVFFGPAMWLLLLELPLLLLPLLLPHTAVEGLTLEGSSTSYAQVKTPRKQNTEYKIHFRKTFKMLFNCYDKKFDNFSTQFKKWFIGSNSSLEMEFRTKQRSTWILKNSFNFICNTFYSEFWKWW